MRIDPRAIWALAAIFAALIVVSVAALAASADAAVTTNGSSQPVKLPKSVTSITVTQSSHPNIPTGSATVTHNPDGSIEVWGTTLDRYTYPNAVVYWGIPGGPPSMSVEVTFVEGPPRQWIAWDYPAKSTVMARGTW